MSILPQELITEILSLLPVKSLLRFRCVSKSWFGQINDPRFIKMHLENNRERTLIVQQSWICNQAGRLPLTFNFVKFSNEDRYQPVAVFPPFYNPNIASHIVGNCNGLVCFRTYVRDAGIVIVIWNPSIRKYKKLPTVHSPVLTTKFDLFNFGFGFDAVNNDYKVVNIWEENLAGVNVYSLKAHSWRRVEDQWPYKNWLIYSWPVFSNGALHWLVKSATGEVRLQAFHLTTERFQEQTLPVESRLVKTLEVLGEWLCVSAYETEAQGVDYWMMKETSWSRLCSVPLTFDRVVFSMDGSKKLLMDNGINLSWYDMKNKTCSIVLPHIPYRIWTGICVGSLLLLDGDSVD